ncbi:unnamed protein product [Candida verbasci]|uniref:PUM-HD domain-containing protein n=1 Tax=Candida verbasci TaxID=1227364 RepID=A0A9W4TWV3_9ASCO|nr:unnamed protein product [Candida verbasci]
MYQPPQPQSQSHYNNHHHHNLSINSISSLIEPTTPPHPLPSTNNKSISSSSSTFVSVGNRNKSEINTNTTPISTNTPNYLSNPNSSFSFHNRSLSTNSFTSKSSNSFNGTNLNSKSILWDSSNKLNQNLNLPNFSIDHSNNQIISTPLILPNDQHHQCLISTTTTGNGNYKKLNTENPGNGNYKMLNTENPGNGNCKMLNTENPGNSIATPILNSYPFDNDKENKLPFNLSAGNSISNNHTPTSSISTPPSTTNLSNNSLTPPVKFTPQQSQPIKIDKEYLASISKIPLIQLKSEILNLAKDQYGCRFLQKKIDENLISNYQIRLQNFEIIFGQIYPFMYELIIDPFGNYLIQKLIQFCNEENLNLLLEILQSHLFQISVNQHGTRALQKIIDQLNNQYQLNLLIKGLKPYIIELIKDLNGNHVIQKILNKYQPIDCQFIYDSIIQDLYIVATHKHGCCVLQKCLNHVTINQLTQFSNSILKFDNFKLLINDQFGNYVLQYLISLNSFDINYKIYENFNKFGISNLCNLKFSSNVVEKFLKNCYNNEILNFRFSNLKFELIYQILISDLNVLINDPFGNYVIQTLIDIVISPRINYSKIEKLNLVLPEQNECDESDLQILIIKYWFKNCKIISSFGKRIQSKINTILNQVTPITTSQPMTKLKKNNGNASQMNANGEFKSIVTTTATSQNSTPNPRCTSSPANFINQEFKSSQQGRNFSLPANFYSSINQNIPQNNSATSIQSNNNISSTVLNTNEFNDYQLQQVPLPQQVHPGANFIISPPPQFYHSQHSSISSIPPQQPNNVAAPQPPPTINYTTNNGQRYTPPPPMLMNSNIYMQQQAQQQFQQQFNQQQQQQQQFTHSQNPSWSSTSSFQSGNGPIYNNW